MMADRYIDFIYHSYLYSRDFDDKACNHWFSQDQVMPILNWAFKSAFAEHGVYVHDVPADFVDRTFDLLVKSSAIEFQGDAYVGVWARIVSQIKDNCVHPLIKENPVQPTVEQLGEPALKRAVGKVAAEFGWAAEISDEQKKDLKVLPKVEVSVPASNRIVTLGHNQVLEIEKKTDEIISVVEELNQIDGDVGLRSLIIGQIKAGRELIRAGAFRLYALEVTLINALNFLARRYEKEAIGPLASALINALLVQLGLS